MVDILRDMAEYLRRPEEVLSMFSDALRQLDKNTELYMIEELEQKIKSEKQRADSAELRASSLQNENQSLLKEIEKLKQQLHNS